MLQELYLAVQQDTGLFADEDKRAVYQLLGLQLVVSAQGVQLEACLPVSLQSSAIAGLQRTSAHTRTKKNPQS